MRSLKMFGAQASEEEIIHKIDTDDLLALSHGRETTSMRLYCPIGAVNCHSLKRQCHENVVLLETLGAKSRPYSCIASTFNFYTISC